MPYILDVWQYIHVKTQKKGESPNNIPKVRSFDTFFDFPRMQLRSKI